MAFDEDFKELEFRESRDIVLQSGMCHFEKCDASNSGKCLCIHLSHHHDGR